MFFRIPASSLPKLLEERDPRDHLATIADHEDIFERDGLHAAFACHREGDELVFHAVVQNIMTCPREVTFRVLPERDGGRGKIPRGTIAATLEPGEAGTLELRVPLPDDVQGRHRCYYDLRAKGSRASIWNAQRRRFLESRITGWQAVLIFVATLGQGFIAGGGVHQEVEIEPADRTRATAPVRGRYERIRVPDSPPEPVVFRSAPLSPATKRAAFAIGGLFVVALTIAGWYQAHPDVFVVNGYDVPIVVEIDGTKTTLAPRSFRKLRFSFGTYDAIAADGNGREIEQVTVRATPPRGTIVWNVAGQAPVYVEEVRYGGGKPQQPRLYCGRNLVEFGLFAVDDAFREPPASAERGSRVHLDVLDLETRTCR